MGKAIVSIVVGVFGALACGACGWLPPDAPTTPTAQTAGADDPDAALVHTWTVAGHVLGDRATLGDADAAKLDGRRVEIAAAAFTAPWQGNCDDAARQRKTRTLADVTTELDVGAAGRAAVRRFGLDDQVVEYRLSCTLNHRAPPLTMFVSGTHAMTCWSGVCYLLTR